MNIGGEEEPPCVMKIPPKRLITSLGPGLITGASDDDPSGIGTYAVAGASAGYATLWLAWYTLPMVIVLQYLCAKIGMVTGRGLAGAMRKEYPRTVLYPAVALIALANTVNAGADIGAMAAGFALLFPVKPLYLVVPIGGALLALQVFASYQRAAKVLKWLTLALLACILACFYSHPNWPQALYHTLVPTVRLDRDFIGLVVAILGTTISPYMFFWQAGQEVEEQITQGRRRLCQRRGATDAEMAYMIYDVHVGMVMDNVVMFFIILTTAATLHPGGPNHQDRGGCGGGASPPRGARGGVSSGGGVDRRGRAGGSGPDRVGRLQRGRGLRVEVGIEPPLEGSAGILRGDCGLDGGGGDRQLPRVQQPSVAGGERDPEWDRGPAADGRHPLAHQ